MRRVPRERSNTVMITIDQLTKHYGRHAALDGVTLAARPGRVTGLCGPNGAGKSTLLRILLGLDRPDSGTAHVHGHPYAALRDPMRTVGAQLDGSGAHRSRRVRHHLHWLARAGGLPRPRVEEVLREVGLDRKARRRAGTLSLGQTRRLGLAAALLGDPPVLVLDEPVNGLDVDGIRQLRSLLRARAEAGGTVLLSSHLMHEVAQVCDDVVLLAAGRIVTSGTVADVTRGHADLEDAYLSMTGGAA